MNEKFAELSQPGRVWAVPALVGDVDKLSALHDYIAAKFRAKDKIVYLGNYLGDNYERNLDILDELMIFRSALMCKEGVDSSDIVFLRGPMEEAWIRLLRLQFSPSPVRTMEMLLGAGVGSYLQVYDFSMNEARFIVKEDSSTISRWTSELRSANRAKPGHEKFMFSMRRAAFTRRASGLMGMIFVPANYDFSKSLEDQKDTFWSGETATQFSSYSLPIDSRETCLCVVRGFDTANRGCFLTGLAVTLDAGCGRGGVLVCGCFSDNGALNELVIVEGERENVRVKASALFPKIEPVRIKRASELGNSIRNMPIKTPNRIPEGMTVSHDEIYGRFVQ
ncbi:MAG: hypothetical protein FWF23_06325 [Alphaproteobacteria bacterium]|nr:hypothetical protein [Alphaproteobacteria bacterium]MCL2505566.1 hypothetical protein [Alphaproteobacteria bacterium]